MRLFRLSLILSGAALLLGAGSAQAIQFNFTSDHCSGTGGCGTPPFGTVTLTQNGANVDVTAHLFSPNLWVKTGSAEFQAFKFNATGVVLADITVDQTVPSQTLAAQTGAFNGNGTGTFAFGIQCTTCAGGASNAFSNDITFHVASATIADLTHPNAKGNLFVADILSSAAAGGTGNTGPVDVSQIPEPATAALLGLGLVGLAAAGRRR